MGFQKKEEVLQVDEGKTYEDVLKGLGINPETVVVVRDGLPVPSDENVEEGEVKILRVISGGMSGSLSA